MKTLYMKIHSFDELSSSLIVSFASDTTQHQDPDQYPGYAFQPIYMWPDIDDPQEIKKRIAISGMHHAEQQEKKEKFVADPAKIQQYKDMVGKQVSYETVELLPPQPVSNEQEIPTQTV